MRLQESKCRIVERQRRGRHRGDGRHRPNARGRVHRHFLRCLASQGMADDVKLAPSELLSQRDRVRRDFADRVFTGTCRELP
jgi:hypothetical protein